MKSRKDAARFIERQLHWKHATTLEKGNKHHYGLQELRKLMDFIYEAKPVGDENIQNHAYDFNWSPDE